MKTATLVGSGPSCDIFDWDRVDGDLCAVSSGIIFVPEMPVHFFAMDPPHLFAKQVARDEDMQKHVPDQNQRWKHKPNVTMWPYDPFADKPCFDNTGSVAQGPPIMNIGRRHSMLFAVQVLPRLGYQRVKFIGCDLNGDEHRWVVDVLKDWHRHAVNFGIEWLNLSPLSALQEFMPDAPIDERAIA